MILLAAHFTTLEISAGMFTLTREAHAVYKPSKDALLTRFFISPSRRGLRRHVRARRHPLDDPVLKGGGIVWYSPDQAFRGKGAEMVPFFGMPAATNTATSRLAS